MGVLDRAKKLIPRRKQAPVAESPVKREYPDVRYSYLIEATHAQEKYEAHHPIPFTIAQRITAIVQRVKLYSVRDGVPSPPEDRIRAAVRAELGLTEGAGK